MTAVLERFRSFWTTVLEVLTAVLCWRFRRPLLWGFPKDTPIIATVCDRSPRDLSPRDHQPHVIRLTGYVVETRGVSAYARAVRCAVLTRRMVVPALDGRPHG
eukprot:2773740-Rhodomonas_salina.1